ncbi:hypothetical protein BJ978_001575 [Agromyces terreus]|uniref:DUF86 domain-containing protein n=1 Tax=Agromyces terreus TaxID=424795 RepID=A0A9X2KBR5_9MICO|nr:HepT-like ribonuclease domain-containing protein [Agromyces terreus]MCP2370899.1 hypothetical protein [Agromyces terreus]
MTDEPRPRFTARPRAERDDTERSRERLLDEVTRLRLRFERARRDGREAFADADSDAYDIGMLAVIHLADLVARQLPASVAAELPEVAREGLRATRNLAAHNYAALDNLRLWATVSTHAPALLDAIEAALQALSPES